MKNKVKRVLIGRPLKNEAIGEEKFGVLWGLPLLSSDAISSVAYAGQEILGVLLPVVGAIAFNTLTYLSAAIVGLLILLTLSYRQTIDNYPNGGGAYIVAKDNLGVLAGVTAGAALSVDYIMTVAVSVSSGIQQITTAYAPLYPYRVPLSIVLILLLALGNLRGIRESSKFFGIPAYAFIFALGSMIVTGFLHVINRTVPPVSPLPQAMNPLTTFLVLKAFASGCTALTGVEAVSNAVPNFKTPAVKHAKTVLLLLSLVVFVLFGGTSILTNYYEVNPANGAVLVQVANEIFRGGLHFMYYFVVITLFIILALAANTAYSGFPMLISVIAREGYAPRQLNMRGDRLSYSNGILVLSAIAAFLVVVFSADVTKLIGLYAVGVFISFTLSQSGMFMRWLRNKGKNWALKAFINGLGAIVTAVAVVIIAIAKFTEGSWIVVFAVPILIMVMLRVKKHYTAVSKQLKITPEELSIVNIEKDTYRNRVIVPIESVNRASIRALRYAKTISDNIIAFNVSIDEENGKKVRERYDLMQTDIPLYIKYSPYRKVVDPLLKFIESTEYDYKKGDMITVVVPQFSVRQWWSKILHNHTRVYLQRELIKHKHIVIAVMPLQLKDDDYVLKRKKTSDDII
ncbi:MAG: APC family permease [Bacillota bacterium]|nr:APC family permease [Bacillota bacterium]